MTHSVGKFEICSLKLAFLYAMFFIELSSTQSRSISGIASHICIISECFFLGQAQGYLPVEQAPAVSIAAASGVPVHSHVPGGSQRFDPPASTPFLGCWLDPPWSLRNPLGASNHRKRTAYNRFPTGRSPPRSWQTKLPSKVTWHFSCCQVFSKLKTSPPRVGWKLLADWFLQQWTPAGLIYYLFLLLFLDLIFKCMEGIQIGDYTSQHQRLITKSSGVSFAHMLGHTEVVSGGDNLVFPQSHTGILEP